ncbi:MAG: hypothetical protein WC975_06205 [Phycisphaerae bacterium]
MEPTTQPSSISWIGLFNSLTWLIPFFLGSVFTFVIEWIKRKWKTDDLYQEVFVGRRIDACEKLLQMLLELCGDISPLERGITSLKIYKGPGTEELPPEEVLYAEEVRQKFNNFKNFVILNQIALGPRVIKVCFNFFGEIDYIIDEIDIASTHDVFLSNALKKILPEFRDRLLEAIKNELAGAKLEFVSTEECKKIFKKGWEKAGERIKERILLSEQKTRQKD